MGWGHLGVSPQWREFIAHRRQALPTASGGPRGARDGRQAGSLSKARVTRPGAWVGEAQMPLGCGIVPCVSVPEARAGSGLSRLLGFSSP